MTSVTTAPNTAVLLLAYGGPDSLADIPAYLADIRGGRHTPQSLIDDITERYRLIGGRSPLLDITRSVATKLQASLGCPVYVGMRHWQPTIQDTVAQMAAEGVKHIIALCMAPHYSSLSIGQYRRKLETAIASSNQAMTLSFIESWHTQPDYLLGLCEAVRHTLARWPMAERESVTTLFTAHSLPAFILEEGDPYQDQLLETSRLLAAQLALPSHRWLFCYQSAAQTNMPWLGPPIEELVAQLADQGQTNLLVAPIGFLADHVEILYDIDIGVQEIARKGGFRVERAPMLNDSDFLVEALSSLVEGVLFLAVT